MLGVKGQSVRLAGAKWAGGARLQGPVEDAQLIEQSVDGIASYLLELSSQLQNDLMLALDPLQFIMVPGLGPAGILNQNEIIKAMDVAAEGLSGQVLKVLQPPLGPYVTPASAEVLASAKTAVETVREVAGQALEFAPPGDLLLHPLMLQDYADAFLESATELIRVTEESVVRLENENIPVYEEDEKAFGFWKVVTVAGVLVGLITIGVTAGQGEK